MQFVPMFDTASGCSSFLIGDEVGAQALVVDPLASLGPDAYIFSAQDLGLTITHIIETHVHADHASAALNLSSLLNIPVGLSHIAPAQFAFEPLSDGQHLTLGSLDLLVWETPGHTPDSISLILTDSSRGPVPWVVLTGDSLFVGDVGRPDLVDADAAAIEEASKRQYDSVRRLMTLPDYTEVWPAHYGASPCGGLFMSPKPQSTIGYERRCNRMLQLADAEEFLDYQRRLVKQAPEEAAALREKNLGF